MVDGIIYAINMNDLNAVIGYIPQIKSPYHRSFKGGCILDQSLNKLDIFEYLITIYDIDQIDSDGMTLLMRAIAYHNNENISLIIKHIKNINITDNYGQTALTLAEKFILNNDIYEKNSHIIKLLIDSGTNPNIEGKNDYSVIDYVLMFGVMDCIFEHLNILLNSKYESTIKIKTLVQVVSYKSSRYYDVIEFLLYYVKDINELCNGHTLLWYTQICENDSKNDIIELLIENGAHF